jgi:superfamily II DNA or RNA helicase
MLVAFTLRPYQERAVHRTLSAYNTGSKRCCIIMPTGTGKTAVFAALADTYARDNQRTLILAHREELLKQAGKACDRIGLEYEIEQGENRVSMDGLFGGAPVVLASVATLRGKRLDRWPKRAFGQIIVDEGHHATARSYVNILAHFTDYCLSLTTATPDRGDGEKIAKVAPHVSFEYPLAQAIDDGYLVRPVSLRPPTHIDLSKISTTGSDLTDDQIARAIEPWIGELCNLVHQNIGERPTLLFGPDVNSSEALADGMRQLGRAWACVHGESEDRDVLPGQFRSRLFQGVSNCQVWTEGFDGPWISAIGLCRFTKSRALYSQMVGRGLRPDPDNPWKQDCLILDFGVMCGKHQLVHPVELFDTTGLDDDIIARARRLIDSGKQPDVSMAMAQAKVDYEEALISRQRRAMHVRVQERFSTFRMIASDPLETGRVLGMSFRAGEQKTAPSPYHRMRLERYKFDADQIRSMTASFAKRLVEQLDARRKKNMATHRQVAMLIGLGVPPAVARDVTFDAASPMIDSLMANPGLAAPGALF